MERPVLYYDFEQGEEVMAWHINEMFAGNRLRLIDTPSIFTYATPSARLSATLACSRYRHSSWWTAFKSLPLYLT